MPCTYRMTLQLKGEKLKMVVCNLVNIHSHSCFHITPQSMIVLLGPVYFSTISRNKVAYRPGNTSEWLWFIIHMTLYVLIQLYSQVPIYTPGWKRASEGTGRLFPTNVNTAISTKRTYYGFNTLRRCFFRIHLRSCLTCCCI